MTPKSDDQPVGVSPQVEQEISWQPGECKRFEVGWQQNHGPLRSDGSDRREPGGRAPPGTYTAVADWRGYEGDGPQGRPAISSSPFTLQ